MHYPGEEGVAEYDSFLEESAGTIMGPIAGLVGGEKFIPKVQPILPKLFKKLVSECVDPLPAMQSSCDCASLSHVKPLVVHISPDL